MDAFPQTILELIIKKSNITIDEKTHGTLIKLKNSSKLIQEIRENEMETF